MDQKGKVQTPEPSADNSDSLRLVCLQRDQCIQRMQSTARNFTDLDTASVHLLQTKIALLLQLFHS